MTDRVLLVGEDPGAARAGRLAIPLFPAPSTSAGPAGPTDVEFPAE